MRRLVRGSAPIEVRRRQCPASSGPTPYEPALEAAATEGAGEEEVWRMP